MHLEEAVLGLLVARQSESFQRSIRSFLTDSSISDLGALLEAESKAGALLRGLVNEGTALESAISDIEKWKGEGISTFCGITLKTPLPISTPPFVLFSKGGNLCNLSEATCLSIVGTRKCDQRGIDIATTLGELVASNGNTVVSGLAAGIDGAAHEGALKAGGVFPTLAVLGNGVNVVYPSIHRRLTAKILDSGGILLSEYEPDERPLPYRFLERNRIIGSLAYGIVVVQASAKSGSLATARFALEMGRDVIVVPGSFGDSRYEGSHRLIQHGAYLLSSFSEVFDFVSNLKRNSGTIHAATLDISLSNSQKALASILKDKGTLHIEELRAIVGHPQTFAEDLLFLELEEVIHHEPGDFLSLRSFVIP